MILGIFAALMFVSTVYDLLIIQRQRHTAERTKSEILSEHTASVGEKSPLLISHEKKLAPKQDSIYLNLLKHKPQISFSMSPFHNVQPRISLSLPGVAERLLLAFSVYSNGKKILQVNQSAGTLTALNGIRFLSISWVVLGHTFAFITPVLSNSYVVLPDLIARWTFQAVANALVSVDSFFALR